MEWQFERILMCLTPFFILLSWKKNLKSIAQIDFLDKTPTEGYFKEVKAERGKKEEDLAVHSPVPETRTNLCSFAKRFINIG